MYIKNFFYFSKTDRLVVLFVVFLGILAIATIYIMGTSDEVTIVSKADSILNKRKSYYNIYNKKKYSSYELPNGRKVELSPFDPNTADAETLYRLGFTPFQIRNIYKYREKGGVFRSPEDIAKLYGLTRKKYEELEPYIHIGDEWLPASTLDKIKQYEQNKILERQKIHEAYEAYKKNDTYVAYKKISRDTVKFPIKIKVGQHINIAIADTTQLKKVPGIGSGWARAIINYRERLGGYVDVGQLKEIDEFPLESLPFFEVKRSSIRKININKLSINQLRKHPYIDFYMAKRILDYRRLKGDITSLSQLRCLKEFPPAVIKRLEPYICF